jgi:hypothetical protein
MNLLPLVSHIEAANLGTRAKTIFVNQMPIECTSGILLRGMLAGTKVDHELPGYYKTKFQLVVRANGYDTGNALANSVVSALTVNNTQIGEMFFKYMRPCTMPVVFPISKGNLLEFAVEFDVAFVI